LDWSRDHHSYSGPYDIAEPTKGRSSPSMCARRRFSAVEAWGADTGTSVLATDGLRSYACGSGPAPLLSSVPKASSACRFGRCILGFKRLLSTWTLAPPMSPQALYALGHITCKGCGRSSDDYVHGLTQPTPMSSRQARVWCKTTEVCTFEGRIVTMYEGQFMSCNILMEDVRVTTCITLRLIVKLGCPWNCTWHSPGCE
jgi:hypothetical protein